MKEPKEVSTIGCLLLLLIPIGIMIAMLIVYGGEV